MTKEKARALLIQIFNTYGKVITANYKDGVIQEAFEMAIEALRKTENCSEKPNNCETCKNWDIVNDHCYFIQECRYEPKTEPMKTADYCDICKRDMCEDCVADATNPYCVPSHYEIRHEPKTEPLTDA